MEIQIITGFLGAGKTTFMNKYLEGMPGRTVIVENEFGSVGIDQELIQEDLPVKEIFAGCICCSLAVEFYKGIQEIADRFAPDRIVIEPSGVGRLSDVVKACLKAKNRGGVDLQVTKLIAIVDISCYDDFKEDFGEFYTDQIENANLLFFSNLDDISAEDRERIVTELHEINPEAVIFDGDFRKTEPEEVRAVVAASRNYEESDRKSPGMVLPADKVFSSVSIKTLQKYSKEGLERCLEDLRTGKYGQILRAKGVLLDETNQPVVFQYTGKHINIYTKDDELFAESGMIVVIGCNLKEQELRELFRTEE